MGVKGEKNSLGIPAITTCPDATDLCKLVCYANTGFFRMDQAKNMYEQNKQSLDFFLKIGVQSAAKLFAAEVIKHNKSGIFRWNIGGDLYSDRYFRMICAVARLTPTITHWLYTRSFKLLLSNKWDIVGYKDKKKFSLVPENLKVNLSYDALNYDTTFNYDAHYYGHMTEVNTIELPGRLDDFIFSITWLGNNI